MAFLNSKQNIIRLFLIAAVALSVQSQRNITNPLLNFRYGNQTNNLFNPLQVLQYDIQRLVPGHPNFTRIVPTTVNASNPFTEALTQINTFFQFVINSTEISFYNARFLFGKVSQYHLALYQNYTTNYLNAIGVLNSVQDTMNLDENGVMNDFVLITDNIATYVANYNQSVINGNTTLNVSANVAAFLSANVSRLTTTLQNVFASYQDLYRRARIASAVINGTSILNMTAALNQTISNVFVNISSVQNYYNAFIQNFTNRGNGLMTQFWAQYNATCIQNELSFNDSQARLNDFSNYLANAKATYWSWTNRLMTQAKDSLRRPLNQDINNFTQVSTEANQICAAQTAEIESWWTQFGQQQSSLADLLSRLSAFSNAESQAVAQMNTAMLALPPLSSPVEFQNSVNGVLGNMSLVVNGPSTTNVAPISVNRTNFTVVSQSTALGYDISWTNQLPPTPPNPTANVPYIDQATSGLYNFSPFTPVPNDVPIGQPICSGAAPQSVAFPAMFTAYPCFDSSQIQTTLYAQTPIIAAKWLSFVFDVSMYNLQFPAAVMISVSAQNPPSGTAQLAQPLSFASSIPSPNQVGTVNPAAGAAGQQTNYNNGWNNFVFSYRVRSQQMAIEVQILVSDVDIARQVNLSASLTFVAP